MTKNMLDTISDTCSGTDFHEELELGQLVAALEYIK